MVNIVFASNNIAHFPGSFAGSVVNTFDAVRLPYSVSLTNLGTISSPVFKQVSGDDTWFHFRYCYTGTMTTTDRSLFKIYDSTGRLVLDLLKKDNVSTHSFVTKLYNGSTNISYNNTVDGILNQINSIDIKLTVTSLLISATIYVNKTYAGVVSFGSNPNVITKPTYFSFGPGMSNSTSAVIHFSEILVGDDDTRNARLSLLRPVAAGASEDWLGSLATLADDDTSTGMTTIEADARQTMVLSAYAGASNISNFITSSMTTRGQNSPTKLKHTIRLSAVDYDSADIPLGNALEYNITDYLINPATSLPWVSSDLSAIEAGFLSVA